MALFHLLSFVLFLPFLMVHSAKDTIESKPGGYSVIPNLGDERVLRAAHFAVSNIADSPYGFSIDAVASHVVAGYQQVVAGMNYKFEIILTQQEDDSIVVGGFRVDVYDQFGQLSVRKWGSEINLKEAEYMWKRYQSTLEDSELN